MKRLITVIAMLFAATAAAADLPAITTRFIIAGKRFTAGMGGQKALAERETGAAIAQMMHDRYPFFDWREESAPGAVASAKMIVTLAEFAKNDTQSRFYLVYERQIAPNWRPEPLRLGADRDLYGYGRRVVPYTDRQTLKDDVIARLTELLDNTRTSDFEHNLIEQVPICACPAVLKTNYPQVIVIHGFAWTNLKAGGRSWLHIAVEVRKQDKDGPEFMPKGKIDLKDLMEADAEIGGYVGEFHCANAYLVNQWDQQKIQDALSEQRAPKMFVYVRDYSYDASVQPVANPD